MLVTHYRYVVVDILPLDAASRLVANVSECVLLVACTDVAPCGAPPAFSNTGETATASAWRSSSPFRKVPGFTESDAEMPVRSKIVMARPEPIFRHLFGDRSRRAGNGTESH